ncbi:MAG TPA: hypothetical protein DET40_12050 [Lentisphaeria bacterium]|nr:MAG: hypothetical protein A2X45_07605 [Lentisphaerae bacterium GWF2_50_93]HCE44272.1 hypothetical protein [Lentisphaeria bacterium]
MGDILKRIRHGKSSEVLRRIVAGMESGRYSSRLPGTLDFAEEFKVNKNTVDKALKKLIEEGLIVRMQGKGTYIAGKEPHDAENGRANSRRYAFIIDRSDYFTGYLKILDACDEEISKINGTTIFVQFDRNESPAKLLGRLRSRQIEGVFACGLIPGELLREIKREFKVILIDSKGDGEPVNYVIWNNYEAGASIARRLIRKGCRHFSCIQAYRPSPKNVKIISPNYMERAAGFKYGIEEAGLKMTTFLTDWKFSDPSLNARIAEELAVNLRKRAVMSPCYQLALQALLKTGKAGLLSSGLKMGTFINSEELCCLTDGAYALLDVEKCARSAASILLDVLGRPSEKYKTVTMDNEYVEI